jgi:hypothetical protein
MTYTKEKNTRIISAMKFKCVIIIRLKTHIDYTKRCLNTHTHTHTHTLYDNICLLNLEILYIFQYCRFKIHTNKEKNDPKNRSAPIKPIIAKPHT